MRTSGKLAANTDPNRLGETATMALLQGAYSSRKSDATRSADDRARRREGPTANSIHADLAGVNACALDESAGLTGCAPIALTQLATIERASARPAPYEEPVVSPLNSRVRDELAQRRGVTAWPSESLIGGLPPGSRVEFDGEDRVCLWVRPSLSMLTGHLTSAASVERERAPTSALRVECDFRGLVGVVRGQ